MYSNELVLNKINITNEFLDIDIYFSQGKCNTCVYSKTYLIWFIVLNVTFSNISAISWRQVLVVEEARVPGENHRPWASNC
jgi:hypothetical protein